MKRLGLILLAVVVLVGFLSNQAGAQTPLKGECHLMIINNSGIPLKEVVLNGQIIGKLSADGIFMKNFQCGAETVSVELCLDGATFLTKEIRVRKGPARHKIPANLFIWKVPQ